MLYILKEKIRHKYNSLRWEKQGLSCKLAMKNNGSTLVSISLSLIYLIKIYTKVKKKTIKISKTGATTKSGQW